MEECRLCLQPGEQGAGVPAGRGQDPADRQQRPLRVRGLVGELEGGPVAGLLDVRQRRGVPGAVGVGEQLQPVPDEVLELGLGPLELAAQSGPV